MRAVIYARYSSENQREASIEDQVEVCRRYITSKGWEHVQTYTDHAISGSSELRPGYLKMIQDAESGIFDAIVCEAIDRVSRRLADVARLHDQLEFRRIELHATNLGEVSTIHIGLIGTMAQLFLSDLRDKTRRGQLGRVLAQKIPAGVAYGYRTVANQPGHRVIDPPEAAIVQRIFKDFIENKSPRAIAKALNQEGTPGPHGREWQDTTIRGQRDRGTGLLNNAIYVGRLEWNRCSYVKDPKTGKRVARPNPRSSWESVQIPDLRIISDETWEAAKAKQGQLSNTPPTDRAALNATHRPKYLLTGLLRCGVCGGTYGLVAQDRYGCSSRRSKGTCTNHTTVTRPEIERRVLDGIKTKLLAPELVREFARTFQQEVNKAAAALERSQTSLQYRLKEMDKKIAALVTAIEDGHYTSALGVRLKALESDRASTAEALMKPAPTIVRLHPRLPDVYAEKVAQLEKALNEPSVRSEAAAILKSVITKIEILPRVGGGVDATLHGHLAQILAFYEADQKKSRPAAKAAEPAPVVSVVAGARFELTTFRL